MAPEPPLLTMSGITKSFPGVRALDGVDLDVLTGEVHCLPGQNGAGKSTLIKVLAGAHQPDDGTIGWRGEQVTLSQRGSGRIRFYCQPGTSNSVLISLRGWIMAR